MARNFSRIKEVVTTWDSVQRVLRSGDKGALVPVVIPKDRRQMWGPFLIGFAFYTAVTNFWLFWRLSASFALLLAVVSGLFFAALGGIVWWRSARVEIEQGTTGVISKWGKITGTIGPGRKFLWCPGTKWSLL